MIPLPYLLRVLFVLGLTGGLLSVFLFFVGGRATSALELILIILLAPLVQGFVLMLYGLVGYPLYTYLAARNMFGLGSRSSKD
jgi:hypothetical protein